MHRLACLTAALLLALSTPAAAERLELANGSTLEGKVISVTDTEVTVRKGAARLTLPLDKLAPSTVVRIRGPRLARTDAQGHLELGDYAAAHGLVRDARRLYGSAGRIDPNMAAAVARRLTSLDDQQAQRMYDRAAADHQGGRHQRALDGLRTLISRYPSSNAVPKARALSKQIVAAMSQPKMAGPTGQAGAKPPVAGPGGGAKQPPKSGGVTPPKKTANAPLDPAKLTGKLAIVYRKVVALIDAGDKANAAGLKADGIGNVSRAKRNYEAAVAQYDAAYKWLQQVTRLAPNRQEDALFNALLIELKKKVVNTLLNAAHTMIDQKNWKNADAYVTQALQIDPANPQALKLKQTIEENRITRKVSKTSNVGPIIRGR